MEWKGIPGMPIPGSAAWSDFLPTGRMAGSVYVRDLGYRWASCGRNATLNFHWRVILLPPRIIEYLVVHELVHLSDPHHTREFWEHLERAMPDFAARKGWLGQHGGEFHL